MTTDDLWRAFANGDAASRNALLTEHLTLVHHVARHLSRALASNANLDELVSCGTIGLINALDAFDPARGLAFSTFAVPRIRGAILDELRRQDHVPRSVRRKTRQLAQARETLGRIFGRVATDAEVAEHLGIELDLLWRWQADSEHSVQISLDHSDTESDAHVPQLTEALSADEESSAEDRINREQEAALLRGALQKLRHQERLVLTLYYYEELKLHEIANVLGLTESRISQIRGKALSRLRAELTRLKVSA